MYLSNKLKIQEIVIFSLLLCVTYCDKENDGENVLDDEVLGPQIHDFTEVISTNFGRTRENDQTVTDPMSTADPHVIDYEEEGDVDTSQKLEDEEISDKLEEIGEVLPKEELNGDNNLVKDILHVESDTENDGNEEDGPTQKMLGAHVLRMEGGDVFEEDEELFHPVPLPTDFSSYDILEKDGLITLEELVNVTGATENVELAFNASDKNGDGKLTPEEFLEAPWSLAAEESPPDEDTIQETDETEDLDEDEPRRLDPEIKRYLLSDEELKQLEAEREDN